MNIIPWINLLPGLGLVGIVMIIHWKWSIGAGSILYASSRMIIQLILIGFVLNFIFNQSNPAWIALILLIMISIASWIALRTIKEKRSQYLLWSLISIFIGGSLPLGVVIFLIIKPSTWYDPRVILPIAGMIYANGMNSVSLSADRYFVEIKHGATHIQARAEALKTALIPITNAFLAVGLVSLPGMMTGQILAGVSPLIAVRYQIMVMCMVFSASGLTAAIFLTSLKQK
ncbi:MAG: putative ABC transport system permease protein [Candidatus Omnitrophota bacterium]|jgi:putative ABC transport system permease protein